jgi:glycosyltransferase involved in cell wall biosynthesis
MSNNNCFTSTLRQKVGIVTAWYERGAGYVSKQYRDALEKYFDVYIFARTNHALITNHDNWTDSRVTWANTYEFPGTIRFYRQELYQWIITNKIDIIFFNEQRWWQPVLWCKEWRIKVGTYVDYYTRKDMDCFTIYDFLVCNTKRHYEVFSWHPQCFYVPWGVDLTVFCPPASKLPSDGNALTFFHSSGMSPYRKGTDLVIKAFESISKPHKLIVHSQVPLIKYFPNLKTLITSLLESGRLTIIQKTVEPPGLYHLGDVYVYPSRLDGLGLTLPEAIACGLPIITTDQAPMKEFCDPSFSLLVQIEQFNERNDGYYWPLSQPSIEHLKKCMESFCERTSEIKQYKEIARKFAENRLDWNNNSMSLKNIFLSTKTHMVQPETIAKINKIESVFIENLYKLILLTNLSSRLFERTVNKYRKIANFIRKFF